MTPQSIIRITEVGEDEISADYDHRRIASPAFVDAKLDERVYQRKATNVPALMPVALDTGNLVGSTRDADIISTGMFKLKTCNLDLLIKSCTVYYEK